MPNCPVTNLFLGLLLAGGLPATLTHAEPLPSGAQQIRAGDQVVLLHGLGRSPFSMASLASHLEQLGFDVHNVGYPSTEKSVAELVEFLGAALGSCCSSTERPLHFVTHSLGGVLLRAYIAERRPENLGRVVMLSPPNKGSELADWAQDSWLSDLHRVPALEELGTDPESLPNQLGPASFELGVITGDKSWHPIGHWLIEGKSDGVVSVESARLEGSRDFLVVPHTHTFIMRAQDVAEQVVTFLQNGHFQRP